MFLKCMTKASHPTANLTLSLYPSMGGRCLCQHRPSLGLSPSRLTHPGQSPCHQTARPCTAPLSLTARYLIAPFCSHSAHGLPEQSKEGFIGFFLTFPAGSGFSHFEALFPIWSLHSLREAKRVSKKEAASSF